MVETIMPSVAMVAGGRKGFLVVLLIRNKPSHGTAEVAVGGARIAIMYGGRIIRIRILSLFWWLVVGGAEQG